MSRATWKRATLKSLCHRIGDGLHGTPEYSDSDIYFINGNNLENGAIKITESTNTVSEEELEKHYIPLNENTLLISINGTLGELGFYNGETVMLGKSAAYLNFKSPINRFYFYYFQLPEIQKYFWNVATGSTIKNLSLKSLQDFEVPVPEEFEWKQISSTLSSIDSKIALNNRINAELEAMAKTIYDYWFVQFDFPISAAYAASVGQPELEGRPYKSSGGEMVWNEEIKRDVPKGWEVKSLGAYAKVKSGFAFKSSWWQDSGVPVLKIKNIQEDNSISFTDCSFVAPDKADKAKNFIGNPGSVIIAMTGATIGKFGIIPDIGQTILINQRVGLFDMRDKPMQRLPFLINSLRQRYVRQNIFKIASGAAQPNISAEEINSLQLILPPQELIQDFNLLTASSYGKLLNNVKENQELASLRDWLLPMLMNGQVKVDDVKGYEEKGDVRMAAEGEEKYNLKK